MSIEKEKVDYHNGPDKLILNEEIWTPNDIRFDEALYAT